MKIILSLFLLLASIHINAQNYNEVERKLVRKTKDLDSVILVSYGSPRSSQLNLLGYGMKRDCCFRVKILFDYKHDKKLKIVFKSIKKSIVADSSEKALLKNTPFSLINEFNKDSLNRTSPYPQNIQDSNFVQYIVCDGATYTLFLIIKHQFSYRSSYEPDTYQLNCPTLDRAKFIEIRNKLLSLLKK